MQLTASIAMTLEPKQTTKRTIRKRQQGRTRARLRRYNVHLSGDMLDALRARSAHSGVPIAEQIRRAITHDLAAHD
jgi:LDH2 family malate/lactate/ureidoglycolate dehydrogenase